jgi:hypothetical protein
MMIKKLTHSGLNSRFDMSVAFTVNYFFSGDDVPVDNKTLLVTDFMNLKIKSAQSFKYSHKVWCAYMYS